jgi:hypothetical protein
MSLFDLMNHSNLWAELRAAAKLDKPGSISVNAAYEHLSDETKATMKEIALHAMGSDALACDEVLLEAQCRQWTDVPEEWAEMRASCTIENIHGAIHDLVVEGRVEAVADGTEEDISCGPKYRRVSVPRLTRCMKIAKPWKSKCGPREWDDKAIVSQS